MLSYGHDRIDEGMSADELDSVEQLFGVRFADVHRAFLEIGLPLGPHWPNWRARGSRGVRAQLRLPTDGVVADVLDHDFWPASWGPRPTTDAARAALARAELARVPQLVPLYARCYLPAGDRRPETPVLTVDRTSVVVGGHDLAHYVGQVFAMHDPEPAGRPLRVPFWSDLVELFDPDRRRPGIMEP